MTKTKAYKAFNDDWTCNGYQYKVGKSYTHEGKVVPCESGFHACTNPFDVLSYYDLCDSRFAVVSLKGDQKEHGDDSKIAAAKITIETELRLPDFIKTCVDFLLDLTKKGEKSGYSAQMAASGYYAQMAASGNSARMAASGNYAQMAASGYYAQMAASGNSARMAASGNYAQMAASGNYARMAASGYSAQMAASGYYAQMAASGDSARMAASGNYAQMAASGENSVIASSGFNTRAKGALGTWISLAEFVDGKCVGFASGKIGDDGLKADVWYIAKGGKLVAYDPL